MGFSLCKIILYWYLDYVLDPIGLNLFFFLLWNLMVSVVPSPFPSSVHHVPPVPTRPNVSIRRNSLWTWAWDKHSGKWTHQLVIFHGILLRQRVKVTAKRRKRKFKKHALIGLIRSVHNTLPTSDSLQGYITNRGCWKFHESMIFFI